MIEKQEILTIIRQRSVTGIKPASKSRSLFVRPTGAGNDNRSVKILQTLSVLLILQGLFSTIYTLISGLNIWGINNKVVWGIAVTNFVFWIGIGHAGTLISAILYLLRQEWRVSFSRLAEAMTIVSLLCAALYLFVHTGRPWLAWYWIIPYPGEMGIWPNFKSPLVWDFFAILVYFLVSVSFFLVGLIPDSVFKFNKLKNKSWSINWIGSRHQWRQYRKAYLLIAGLATPLVISVHSIVSYDFAVTLLPGWHSTFFPPYFVAGAIYSGCAMVMTLSIIIRKLFNLGDLIQIKHYDKLAKVILAGSFLIAFFYVTELFFAWYSGNANEQNTIFSRITGINSTIFYLVIIGNIAIPQLFWIARMRKCQLVLLLVSISINIGMWFERFMIIVSSQEMPLAPVAVKDYLPTVFEISIALGIIGFFISIYLLIIRRIPPVPVAEYFSEGIHEE